MSNDAKVPNAIHNGSDSPSHSKTPSISSSTATDPNASTHKKRLESMTDDDIIQKNLKELMDKKNRVSFKFSLYLNINMDKN